MKKFKILSIDGGGSKGIFPLGVLKTMKHRLDINFIDTFDLVTGTSTGSIVTACMAFGIKVETVIDLYYERLEMVFKKTRFNPQGIMKSRYDYRNLEIELSKIFKNLKLKDAKIPIIIPATDISNCAPIVYSSFGKYKDMLVVEAVLSSCLAPTFFKPYLFDNRLVSDGVMWANNPSLHAIIEARTVLGVKEKQIHCLSLGTGRTEKGYSVEELNGSWGILQWLKRFDEVLFDADNEAMKLMAEKMIGDRYIRINSVTKIGMDETDAKILKTLEMQGVKCFLEHELAIKQLIAEEKFNLWTFLSGKKKQQSQSIALK